MAPSPAADVPFDGRKLEALMEQYDVDVLLVSSRHNTRYLTGGYYHWFHARMARAADQRYLTFVGIPRGRLQDAFFVGGMTEEAGLASHHIWIPDRHLTEPRRSPFFQSTRAATEGALRCLRRRGLTAGRVGVELEFLPASSYRRLHAELPDAELVDATGLLGELRAVKTPSELEILRRNAAGSVEAVQATLAASGPGDTTALIHRRLQSEMALRDLELQWLIICMGPDGVTTKWPSERVWAAGEVLRVDPGSSSGDYVADLCRMACLGEPSARAEQMIADCIAVNDRLQAEIRPGMTCGELNERGQHLLAETAYADRGWHIVHGCGMVPHEPPVVRGDPSYVLQEGMVMSMETQFQHPEVGDIKMEDIVAVTAGGCECLTPAARSWIRAGASGC